MDAGPSCATHDTVQPPPKRRRKAPPCAAAPLRPLKGLKSFAVEVAAKVRDAGAPVEYSTVADALVKETLTKLESKLASAAAENRQLCTPLQTAMPSQPISSLAAPGSAAAAAIASLDRSAASTMNAGPRGVLPMSPLTASPSTSPQTAHRPASDSSAGSGKPACSLDGTGYDRAYEEKNIHRRVYDALNVLYAMGLIARTGKKQIVWRGVRGFLDATHPGLSVEVVPPNPHPSALDRYGLAGGRQGEASAGHRDGSQPSLRASLAAEIAAAKQRVAAKKSRMTVSRLQVDALEAQIRANMQAAAVAGNATAAAKVDSTGQAHAFPPKDRYHVPFTILAVPRHVPVHHEIERERTSAAFIIGGDYKLIDGMDLVRMLTERPVPVAAAHETPLQGARPHAAVHEDRPLFLSSASPRSSPVVSRARTLLEEMIEPQTWSAGKQEVAFLPQYHQSVIYPTCGGLQPQSILPHDSAAQQDLQHLHLAQQGAEPERRVFTPREQSIGQQALPRTPHLRPSMASHPYPCDVPPISFDTPQSLYSLESPQRGLPPHTKYSSVAELSLMESTVSRPASMGAEVPAGGVPMPELCSGLLSKDCDYPGALNDPHTLQGSPVSMPGDVRFLAAEPEDCFWSF